MPHQQQSIGQPAGASGNARTLRCLHRSVNPAGYRKTPGTVAMVQSNFGDAKVIAACQQGDSSALQHIIRWGEHNLDEVDEEGETAAHWAAAGNYSAMIEMLADAGADLAMPNHFGDTPVARAVAENNPDCLRMLLDNKVSVLTTNVVGQSPLSIAMQQEDEEIAGILLGHDGSNVDQRDKDGKTALHFAVDRQAQDLVVLLLEHGASSIPDNEGWTPLHHAASAGCSGVVGELIIVGHSAGAQTGDGRTAIDLSRDGGHAGVSALLDEADINLASVQKRLSEIMHAM